MKYDAPNAETPEQKKRTEDTLSEVTGEKVEISSMGEEMKGVLNDSFEFGHNINNALDEEDALMTGVKSFSATYNYGDKLEQRAKNMGELANNTVIVD